MTGRQKGKGKDPQDAWLPKQRGDLRHEAGGVEVGESVVGQVKSGDSMARRNGRTRGKRRGAKVSAVSVAGEEREKDTSASNNLVEENREFSAVSGAANANSGAGNDVAEESRENRTEDGGREPEMRRSAEGDEESALQRLEAVVKRFVKPSISRGEVDSNLQEQADEILVLESMYGDDFKRIGNELTTFQSFMILLNVELPSSLTLLAEIPAASGPRVSSLPEDLLSRDESLAASTSCGSKVDRQQQRVTVQSLPPIQLVFTLPPSYPSHSPPLFALYASWLNSEKLSTICASLDEISNDQQGQVVLYTWIDWLQNQSLSLLEGSEVLELGPYGVDGTICRDKGSDLRAVSGCYSFNSDLACLLEYDEKQQIEEFGNSLHTCNICFTEQLGKEFAKMPCEHMFCWGCMKTYASVHVSEGSVNKLNCPDTTCKHSIPPFILKELLDEGAFDRWEDLVLKRSLDGMEDIVYCPRCETVCIEEGDHFVQCGNCFFSFCSLCRQTWHVGQECVSPEARLLILQGRQNGGSGEEQRRKEKELMNELMNLQYVRREAKQCPHCKMAISKTEGCNKMVCSNCGKKFCFKCGKAILGYEHFRDGSCQLFEAAEIAAWQPQMAFQEQQAQIEIQLELWPERGRNCPNCRQLNAKNGNNNHMYCWSCRSSFCCLCNKVVRRTSEHYGVGPNKCRQHTVD